MVSAQASELLYSAIGRRLHPPVITRLMNDALSRPGLISLAAGFTAAETLPVPEVSAAVDVLLCQQPQATDYLQYGMTAGRPALRQAILDRLCTFPGETGMAAMTMDNVLLTTGSQQALYLAAQVLCNPGDRVLVEAPSYFVFLELLGGLGIEAVSMPVDATGIPDMAALQALLRSWESAGESELLKAVYLGTYYANPGTRCWSMEEKSALGALLQAQCHCPVVIEDAAYRELYFREPHTAPSLFSNPQFDGIPVLYCGTFTKPLATGLKVGYALSSHQSLLTKLLQLKGHHDFGSAHFTQAIVEQIVLSGVYDQLLLRNRAYYQHKMAAFEASLLAAGLRTLGWQWDSPQGGILLWAKAPGGMDTGFDSAFYQACLAANILYVPGDLCFSEGTPNNFIRLSIGAVKEAQMNEASQALARATEIALSGE